MSHVVTPAPHVRDKETSGKIMREVLFALTPACVMGIYFFGVRALIIILTSVAACVLFEALYQKVTKQTLTVSDCSAALTGLLLAFNLPASAPFWMPVVGAFVAVIIAKQLFGGIGQNFVNPALSGRAFLMAAYTPQMASSFSEPLDGFKNFFTFDTVTSATPLINMAEEGFAPARADYINSLLGMTGGCIGEVCAAALIAGGVYLLVKKIISWHIPVTFLGVSFLFILVFGNNPAYHMINGGMILGAFFMATDYATSPVTVKGRLIFGAGCGILVGVIRLYGGYPEGVCYAILLMNLAVPLIDRYTRPRVYGVTHRKKKSEV